MPKVYTNLLTLCSKRQKTGDKVAQSIFLSDKSPASVGETYPKQEGESSVKQVETQDVN